VVEHLLAKGASVNPTNTNQLSPLGMAAVQGDLHMVLHLANQQCCFSFYYLSFIIYILQ
jgi:hypothetical protein